MGFEGKQTGCNEIQKGVFVMAIIAGATMRGAAIYKNPLPTGGGITATGGTFFFPGAVDGRQGLFSIVCL